MTAPVTAPASLDYSLFQAVNGLAGQHRALDALMIGLASYSPIVLALLLAGMWLTWKPRMQCGALVAGISALIALGIGQIIGRAFPRERPYLTHQVALLVPHAPDTSFPSDHATLAFAVAVLLWQVDRRLGMGLLLFGVLVGFARVFIGAHYPTDVLGGAVLGSVVSLFVARLSRTRPIDRALDRLFGFLARLHLAAKRPSGTRMRGAHQGP
ncbi:MAG: undecaprenyl-diphosphatase [Gemmatimonadaceae bacterium]